MLHLLSRSVFLLILFVSLTAHAEDVHLDSCDGLPVVEVAVPGVKAKMRFLVDTAATSILNSKSFSSGDPNKIAVTSWRGTVETRASAVTIAELIIGQHHHQRPASPCGGSFAHWQHLRQAHRWNSWRGPAFPPWRYCES